MEKVKESREQMYEKYVLSREEVKTQYEEKLRVRFKRCGLTMKNFAFRKVAVVNYRAIVFFEADAYIVTLIVSSANYPHRISANLTIKLGPPLLM